jgi:two-component system, NtrC family, nitrogen regulation response regulator GlnG
MDETRVAIREAEPGLGLRILAHPDLVRVGALCTPFAGELSRLAPAFSDGPLATLHVSRTPVSIAPHRDGVTLHAPVHARLTLEGTPIVGEHRLSAASLKAGVVLTLGRAVALWLGQFQQGAAPRLPGFVGYSAAAAALQRTLAQLAPQHTPVLLLGAPGAGKRTAAQTLHALGARGVRPLTHGIDDDAAYIEELCALDAAQQAALAARLDLTQSGRVIAGCAHEPPPALRARFTDVLQLPTLQERPEDIAPLFVHFVRAALQRLHATVEQLPFVPAVLVAKMVRAPWRENARQLRAFADAYALANLDQPEIDLETWLAALPTARRASGLSLEELRIALAANGRNVGRVAAQLGVTRRSLRQRLRKLGLAQADSD